VLICYDVLLVDLVLSYNVVGTLSRSLASISLLVLLSKLIERLALRCCFSTCGPPPLALEGGKGGVVCLHTTVEDQMRTLSITDRILRGWKSPRDHNCHFSTRLCTGASFAAMALKTQPSDSALFLIYEPSRLTESIDGLASKSTRQYF